ncbi:adenosylcobinamide-GDP ribazoletransferase [Gluconobacter wancherniae]|uniref:adenosylcobinamide-GDP ribazoletransferase n=1 Tax=Gluconobacter wancherniae TaxID=1307955 RepID=UPI0011BE89C0|nr:adenosylcobinamide-GDP ribazoletransferase [Gluconobacter wancherniae]MBF0853146.1 adenosylcobinamide-GDP ribazoletransferase [Gluconobacter wancherniae]GBD56136.1 adenosylcobinamide-GDP ribazoletransferase [Gluconobacter wancherniae NBRC 103581]
MNFWRQIREDIACGMGLLTRIPTGWLCVDGMTWSLTRSVWCWPVVGALIGAAGGAVFQGLSVLHVPSFLSALWAVAFQVLLTGGLHEDGMADMADGCGGGYDRERKLAIMRDSRIGSYGVLSLTLTVMARVSAIAVFPPSLAIPLLAATGAISRMVLAAVPLFLSPARPDGLASKLMQFSKPALWVCMLAGLGVAVACTGAALGFEAVLIAGLVVTSVVWFARRQLGGFTGDVLGATATLVECASLTFFAAIVSH